MKTKLDFEFLGDETTTELFWDCECEKNYIHPKTVMGCPICGAFPDSSPDSHTQEVIDLITSKLEE